MSILKFVNGTPRDIQGMYDYMLSRNKTEPRFVFGLGVNPMNAVPEMKLVQYLYGKYNLKHEYKQVIFSFDVGIKLEESIIMEVCIRIGNILMQGEKRQILGAIHGMGTNKIHCHYMINYVGNDGSLFRQKYSVVYYKDRVNEILSEYGLMPIYYFGN